MELFFNINPISEVKQRWLKTSSKSQERDFMIAIVTNDIKVTLGNLWYTNLSAVRKSTRDLETGGDLSHQHHHQHQHGCGVFMLG